MSAGMPYGLQAMLKDGYTHMTGMSEAVLKNLEACKELSKISRTSLGPNGMQAPTCLPPVLNGHMRSQDVIQCCAGMNKIVINHLDKVFVTSDASVMVTELEVQHPAAKLVVMAAKAQESEIGDGTNMVRTAKTAVDCAPPPRTPEFTTHQHRCRSSLWRASFCLRLRSC